jgi:inhibitor of KinA sporulation pathway (predicted exonuclease)
MTIRAAKHYSGEIMAKRLDQILVVDVEATCWEGSPPPGQTNEIIEIGLVTLDVATAQRLTKRSILVRPHGSKVSEFCTKLTTITPEMVESGITLKEACRIIRDEYDGANRLFASWGDYDRRQFERQCKDAGISYPFGPTHLNVKNLCAILLGCSHEFGVPEGCAKLGLPFEGTHHRGDDDAWNIAGVLGKLLGGRQVKMYSSRSA